MYILADQGQRGDERKNNPPVPKRVPRVWDIRPDEPPKAYAAFLVYRSMGVSRTLEKAAEQLGVKPTTVSKLSIAFAWVHRADQWDAWALRQRSHSAEVRVLREAQLEANTISDLIRMTRILAKRTMLQVVQNRNVLLTPQGAATLADIVVKLSRLQRGEVTDRRENVAKAARERVSEKLDRVSKALAEQVKKQVKDKGDAASGEVH